MKKLLLTFLTETEHFGAGNGVLFTSMIDLAKYMAENVESFKKRKPTSISVSLCNLLDKKLNPQYLVGILHVIKKRSNEVGPGSGKKLAAEFKKIATGKSKNLVAPKVKELEKKVRRKSPATPTHAFKKKAE